MSSVLRFPRAEDAPEIAGALLSACEGRRIFAFHGDLGTGKTTLIKALCEELGVKSGTSSPSFSIVNEYVGTDGPVYHFDLYRLKEASELEGIGFTEYLDSGNYCFVEWPELARGSLPSNTVHIRMRMAAGDGRTIDLAL